MGDVIIAGVARTPIGKLGGSLATISAIDLGARAISGALNRAGLEPGAVDQVIMGTVISAGLGQVPARQAAIKAGIPVQVPALTINKACASGLKAVNLAAQMINTGDAEIVVAGGMESMSRAPYLLDQARFGYRMGDAVLTDAMMRDGLQCPIAGVPMHEYGSDVAAEYGVGREQQDRWAMCSQQRYQAALAAGKMDDEIVPIEVERGKKEVELVGADEQPRPTTTLEVLSRLKPLKPGGSVTAGNAPSVNDGAAALILMSGARARRLGITPLATVLAQGEANDEPRYLHRVPAFAIQAALRKLDLDVEDMGLFEINEAFAAVTLTSAQLLGIGGDCVNVNGGAVALGHPIGASGARILGALILEMRRRDTEYGAAGICSGLGQGEATIVRRGG
ncbi:MAG: acetyl-CoA C-acyltransferase [Chloroflexota bacterium]|nr:MAG: acetyl-CoA C-acyltransferase [Chloroflexota bacterium]